VNELALFAGAGGGILGGKLLGWRTVCAVEWEPYAASVLVQRQNDGILAPFPIWDDVQTFDGRPWRGIVDVVSGGFPCQDISAAGKGAGIDGERSGMWREMARIICEVRPRYAFIENSPMLTTRGLDRVLSDLASMGFDARWGVLGAADVGAPHQRDRIWVVADSNRERKLQQKRSEPYEWRRIGNGGGQTDVAYTVPSWERRDEWQSKTKRNVEMADTNSAQRQRNERSERAFEKHANTCCTSWWDIEPDVGRVADGVAARVDRLKAIGNGQVPAVAATAWKLLSEA
jgi:DNA (cytosine-5)-methyltransferase 1